MAISPGTYLALRRQAAGLTLEEVASQLATAPHLNERARIEWLRRIEADEYPMSSVTLDALREMFRFDATVLLRLDDLRHGARLPEPRLCRECGCSELDACDTSAGRCGFLSCHWVADDLCSACAARSGTAPAPIGAAA
jgi:hypothetical protein